MLIKVESRRLMKMTKFVVALFGLCICMALCNVALSVCPPIPCHGISYPKNCRTVTFFVDGDSNGEVCQGCDACIKKKKGEILDNGCPVKACTMQFIPEICRRDHYYVYRGSTVCKDCSEDIC